MADELDKLAVGIAEDHKAARRKAKATPEVTPSTVNEPETSAPSGELAESLQALGDAVDARDENQDRATDLMTDRLVAIAETAELDRGTLVGDVRDTLLDLFKANPKPWSALLEDQQRRVADALETAARTIVRSIVVIVAEDDAAGGTIHAKLESYAEKGGLKIALTANGDRDTVLALHDAVGQQVVVKRADTNRYGGERRPLQTDPDQAGLGFEADQDGHRDPFTGPEGDDDLVDAAEGLGSDQD